MNIMINTLKNHPTITTPINTIKEEIIQDHALVHVQDLILIVIVNTKNFINQGQEVD